MGLVGLAPITPLRTDLRPRIAASTLCYVERHRRIESPAAERLQKRALAPHYPKDLVAHHRQQRGGSPERHPAHCPPLPTPAPGPRAPRSTVRGTAAPLAQWLALVCAGDDDDLAAALQVANAGLGLDEQCRTLFSCLADEGQVLYADLKDDDTLAAQMQELVEQRVPVASFDAEALGGADLGGAARCEALLAGLREWLAATAPDWYLLQLDQGQDDWMGFLVRRALVPDLQRLSRELGLSGRLV